ncbi:IS66 family transposase [Blastomonas fulva]|uniref:IS66 family transposase n=1 Tax=Blastomonas fulva TaxID=1550728 RepID=UPI003F7002B8
MQAARLLRRLRFLVTPRGLFGPSLLLMLLIEKFGPHQSLNCQRDRYAREGIELSHSTLTHQVGVCTAALMPIYCLIEAHVLAADRLHGEDTTVPVLAKIKTDRPYVLEIEHFGGPAPPVAILHYARDKQSEHPIGHLRSSTDILQADVYAGYDALFRTYLDPAPLTRFLCLSQAEFCAKLLEPQLTEG